MDLIVNLNALMEFGATTVVAGHKIPGLADSITFTSDYIFNFNREAKTAGTSEALITKIRELGRDVLDNFILVNSAQVGVGEISPWEE